MVPPQAAAIAYLRYDLEIGSGELIARAREEKSVLLVPGDQLNMDRYIRVGFGYDVEILEKGLELFSELLETVRSEVAHS